jgi:hypothetical protein
MTSEQFWAIVEDAHRRSGGDMDLKCHLLDGQLRTLPLNEILSFREYFRDFFYRAYTEELWAAAYIIGHGCSEIAFMDFRSTLISMGREVFENALANPESLADIHYNAETAHYEGYQYVSSKVYRDFSGEDPPRSGQRPTDPTGKRWHKNQLPERYPKLVKKYNFG